MYKPAFWLVRQVNVLVSTWHMSLLKGASKQASLSSLFPHYQADFFADLVLVFGVMIRKLYFILCVHCLQFRYVCYLLCAALLLIFRLDITCIVLLICCSINVSLQFPTFFPTFLFCSFSFQISLESSMSILYFWFFKDFQWFAYRNSNLVSLMSQ